MRRIAQTSWSRARMDLAMRCTLWCQASPDALFSIFLRGSAYWLRASAPYLHCHSYYCQSFGASRHFRSSFLNVFFPPYLFAFVTFRQQAATSKSAGNVFRCFSNAAHQSDESDRSIWKVFVYSQVRLHAAGPCPWSPAGAERTSSTSRSSCSET